MHPALAAICSYLIELINMKLKSTISYLLVALVLLNACSVSKQNTAPTDIPSLKEVFKNDFLIGTALNISQIQEKDAVAAMLVPQQFNVVTAENVMKSVNMQPRWNDFNFKQADQFVKYATSRNLKIVGHTLVWHSQLPEYMKSMQSADSVRQFVANQITSIAGRYKDKIYSWDVVNEALNEDGSMRQSVFLKTLGYTYVVDAFKQTAVVSPKSELYYNDYNIEQPKKRFGCIALVKEIQAAGVKIDGVGIQGHWHLGKVPFKEIEESIIQYAALGLKVAITELDINVLPTKVDGADVNTRTKADAASNPYSSGLPDSVQKQLADDYTTLFKLFLKHKDKISRVTFWGVHDGQSWLNGWPIPGRTNYPLLFDRKGNPKPAFYSVIATQK